MPTMVPLGRGVRPMLRVNLQRVVSAAGELTIETAPPEVTVEVGAPEITIEVSQPMLEVDA